MSKCLRWGVEFFQSLGQHASNSNWPMKFNKSHLLLSSKNVLCDNRQYCVAMPVPSARFCLMALMLYKLVILQIAIHRGFCNLKSLNRCWITNFEMLYSIRNSWNWACLCWHLWQRQVAREVVTEFKVVSQFDICSSILKRTQVDL